jgi:hypothetical protein
LPLTSTRAVTDQRHFGPLRVPDVRQVDARQGGADSALKLSHKFARPGQRDLDNKLSHARQNLHARHAVRATGHSGRVQRRLEQCCVLRYGFLCYAISRERHWSGHRKRARCHRGCRCAADRPGDRLRRRHLVQAGGRLRDP